MQKKIRIRTTNEYPIKPQYFYIVDFRNYYRYKIYPVYFLNKENAKRVLKRNIKDAKERRLHFGIVKGRKIKDLDRPYLWKRKFFNQKYQYLKKDPTYQERKSYRTLIRRRLRRMGLLTLIQPKIKVDKKRPYTKIIKNHQKVAKSPNTIARVFQVERKPKRYYYLILNMEKGRKKILMRLKVLRLNIKNGEVKKMNFNLQRIDVIKPYILTEIGDLIKEKPFYERTFKRLQKKGFDLVKTKQKRVL